MKINLLALVILTMFPLLAFSQSGTNVERAYACSLNDGFSISDAVSIMRSFNWDEDAAPRYVALNEGVYVSDTFRENWDFYLGFYYTSMSDLAEKRLAFRARNGSSEGFILRDVASCSSAPRLNGVDFVQGPAGGGDAPAFTAMISTNCDVNPEVPPTMAAQNIAAIMGENLRNMQIITRQFGGPSEMMGAPVGFRAVFDSPDGFSEAMDSLRLNPPGAAPACRTPGAWLRYKIFDRED